MSSLRAPSNYSEEPPRHPSLVVNSQEPFNAEPPRSALIASYVTPVDLFYKRNHGPIPVLDDIERYRVTISGLVEKPHDLSMADIRKLSKHTVTATLQCAGNRRTAMSKVKPVKGVGWDVSAIGNAIWGGAKLADVLELVGISKLTSVSPLGGKHVEFVSVDMCKEEKGGPYKSSIPLLQATNLDAEVILAYEMNGEPLNRDHGYPLRVIVPGVIGARSVKWLSSINIIENECQCLEVVGGLSEWMYLSMEVRHGRKQSDTRRVLKSHMLLMIQVVVTSGHGCCLRLKQMSLALLKSSPKQLI
ncbi:hypothetical protein ABKV19_015986 [Rosa sericea]